MSQLERGPGPRETAGADDNDMTSIAMTSNEVRANSATTPTSSHNEQLTALDLSLGATTSSAQTVNQACIAEGALPDSGASAGAVDDVTVKTEPTPGTLSAAQLATSGALVVTNAETAAVVFEEHDLTEDCSSSISSRTLGAVLVPEDVLASPVARLRRKSAVVSLASPAATITEPSSGPDDTDADPDYHYDGVSPEEDVAVTGEASTHSTRDVSRVFEGVVLADLSAIDAAATPARATRSRARAAGAPGNQENKKTTSTAIGGQSSHRRSATQTSSGELSPQHRKPGELSLQHHQSGELSPQHHQSGELSPQPHQSGELSPRHQSQPATYNRRRLLSPPPTEQDSSAAYTQHDQKLKRHYERQLEVLCQVRRRQTQTVTKHPSPAPLSPVGTNRSALQYCDFPLNDIQVHPIDVVLLIITDLRRSYSPRLLELLVIRDLHSLQRDLSRFSVHRFHDGGRRAGHLASPRMAVRRRGVFVGVVYYRRRFYSSECTHETVELDEHGYCIYCLFVVAKAQNFTVLPCHQRFDDHGLPLCECCGAMTHEAFKKRSKRWDQLVAAHKAGTQPKKPTLLPRYIWSQLHANIARVVAIHAALKRFGLAVPQSVDEAVRTAELLHARESQQDEERRAGKPLTFPAAPQSSPAALAMRRLFERARTEGVHVLSLDRPRRPLDVSLWETSTVVAASDATTAAGRREYHLLPQASGATDLMLHNRPDLETAKQLNRRVLAAYREAAQIKGTWNRLQEQVTRAQALHDWEMTASCSTSDAAEVESDQRASRRSRHEAQIGNLRAAAAIAEGRLVAARQRRQAAQERYEAVGRQIPGFVVYNYDVDGEDEGGVGDALSPSRPPPVDVKPVMVKEEQAVEAVGRLEKANVLGTVQRHYGATRILPYGTPEFDQLRDAALHPPVVNLGPRADAAPAGSRSATATTTERDTSRASKRKRPVKEVSASKKRKSRKAPLSKKARKQPVAPLTTETLRKVRRACEGVAVPTSRLAGRRQLRAARVVADSEEEQASGSPPDLVDYSSPAATLILPLPRATGSPADEYRFSTLATAPTSLDESEAERNLDARVEAEAGGQRPASASLSVASVHSVATVNELLDDATQVMEEDLQASSSGQQDGAASHQPFDSQGDDGVIKNINALLNSDLGYVPDPSNPIFTDVEPADLRLFDGTGLADSSFDVSSIAQGIADDEEWSLDVRRGNAQTTVALQCRVAAVAAQSSAGSGTRDVEIAREVIRVRASQPSQTSTARPSAVSLVRRERLHLRTPTKPVVLPSGARIVSISRSTRGQHRPSSVSAASVRGTASFTTAPAVSVASAAVTALPRLRLSTPWSCPSAGRSPVFLNPPYPAPLAAPRALPPPPTLRPFVTIDQYNVRVRLESEQFVSPMIVDIRLPSFRPLPISTPLHFAAITTSPEAPVLRPTAAATSNPSVSCASNPSASSATSPSAPDATSSS